MEAEIPSRIRICRNCAKKFVVGPRRGKAVYCSAQCRAAAWARKDRVENPERQREANRKYYSNPANRVKSQIASRIWKDANKEAVRKEHREWCRRNKDKCRAWNRIRYYADPKRSIEAAQAWVARNPERRMAYRKAHYQANRAYYLANAKLRKCAVRRATPPWLTSEERDEIVAIYDRAIECGLHVDHIIPLQGKTVCGLHIPDNLQLLSREANRAKSNRLLEDAA